MTSRSSTEPHRASTPLELFFDLSFVVAIAQAGGRLVHSLAEGHPWHGIGGYVLVFFAIWWAWVNFTWFASAYDSDDPLYRVAVLIQITGVLVLAAGVPRAFDNHDYKIAIAGYLIMRLAQMFQWLRAAHDETDPAARRTALRYAAGLLCVQIAWVVLLVLPHAAWNWGFVPLALAEMAVPAIAERERQTTWHPHHIAERYGLFTLIVLGESVSAATIAIQSALDDQAALGELLPISAGGLLIVFSAYWIYFAVPIHDYLVSGKQAFLWGYGHYVIFGSAAAIGAGMEVAVEQAVGVAHVSLVGASACATIPTALFMFTVWAIHSRHHKRGLVQQLILPGAAALVLLCTFAGKAAVPLAGVVAALAVAAGVVSAALVGEGDVRPGHA
ncbi:low temperature requirement protein A [Streptomyces sp. SID3343]|uniref:low temperature requirement protein A n=1 Tax=Streptomyces sp. SID3343 TaxID=2690260 RepID=UPI00136E3498|nr:low temperature requirement protein A [Streptomyces sp. SID3343]MYW04798.1 low temperature requirement protein A [Streptomyces sp. SID3343]